VASKQAASLPESAAQVAGPPVAGQVAGSIEPVQLAAMPPALLVS